jgi:hypothetical protein
MNPRRAQLQAELAALDAEEIARLEKVVPGANLPRWKVLGKRVVDQPSVRRHGPVVLGVQLVLVCEREGRKREAVVDGYTWSAVKVGDEVGLREDLSLPRCEA